MDRSLSPRRRLHRIRAFLALLAVATALLIAAACRLESTGRAIAAIATVGCLVAWVALLELEGAIAERIERRTAGAPRRTGPANLAPPARRRPRPARRRRAA